ncbi:deoxycytidylate deaminase-like [Gadus chalcogrammus]|uniref:deoxycytidylate deaminase-like n=1 Tax=Gadus chalcogrammus TaxID=1042646 RepID=UPI0024C211C4|nr:deoxycytidylate deaminase-like [Gadus chalcogrammus]
MARLDFLAHNDYCMAVAALAAKRSKDPETQVGACIVNQENDIVGIGYNRMPKGCDDDKLSWKREGRDKWDTKYPYVCCAVLEAIMNKNGADLKGCTIYTTLFPGTESDKLIIGAGITKVVYLSDQYRDMELMAASKNFLKMAGIEFR